MYTVVEADFSEWNKYWNHCLRANLMQAWEYGEAKKQGENWKIIRFLIEDEKKQVVSIAQFLVKALPLIGGVARLNRGPLVVVDLNEDQQNNIIVESLKALLHISKTKRWWMVQMAPELNNAGQNIEQLKILGLRQLTNNPWASGYMLLEPDEEKLLMSLKGKWRNCLRKSWKQGVSVSLSSGEDEDFASLIESYNQLQKDKAFSGIPASILQELVKQQGDTWDFKLFFAKESDSMSETNETIGTLVSVRHGNTSMYLIGSTSDRGRALNANYTLLWEAVLHAKKDGCKWFDIGGLNEETPKGIAHFKQGLNSNLYALVGEWQYIFMRQIFSKS